MMHLMERTGLSSDYFQLFKIGNCYAAIGNEIAASNAGFIDLWDKAIIIDTFLNLDAAKDLKNAVKELVNKPIQYVINTHLHYDHIVGNQIFEVPIISTKYTEKFVRTW